MKNKIELLIINLILLCVLLITANQVGALEKDKGEELFNMYCSGCHVNGGNIIRRNKTLKLKALQRNGLDNPEEIARVAREGTGSMNGYINNLGEGGDQVVANWIWKQAQNAWTQG